MAKRTCTVPECERETFCRGWCQPHYRRWLHHGDVQAHIPIKNIDLGLSLGERFWRKVSKDGPLGCWLWTASLDGKGYGQFIIMRADRGYPQRAHRIAWELLRGPIPDDLVVDHRCRNRTCVNPDHLELVTNEENIARGLWTPVINTRKTHCTRGHPFDEDNTYRPPGRPHVRQCRTCQKNRDKGRLR
ncbi:HNH endonuclease signature motif containing protein [Nonomuraea sp. NPDC049646]|uniref:HNH endonuclease signature motif containing protein n=1 Tax=unclassified Nonomuraea TaxID=2593643 RepID=UPI0037A4783E